MPNLKTLVLGIGTALTLGTASLAGTGAEGYFQLYNDTEGNVLIGFYTNDGSGWSANWIDGVEIMPGESGTAEFTADTGNCEQVFAAGWLGGDGEEIIDEPASIDICEASNVYLGDNEVSYD